MISRIAAQREGGARRRRHLLDRGEERRKPRGSPGKLLQRLGHEKHFIRIANHALPAEIANAIHNLHGTCSSVSQIAAVEDQVGRGLP